MERRVEFKLVGMTFLHELPYGAAFPDDFIRLHGEMEQAKADDLGWGDAGDAPSSPVPAGPLPLALFRNPDNEYDTNAIEVHCPLLGRKGMLGHVPRDLAARLAKSIDRGDVWSAWLETVLVDPEHESNPGALVAVVCESIAAA